MARTKHSALPAAGVSPLRRRTTPRRTTVPSDPPGSPTTVPATPTRQSSTIGPRNSAVRSVQSDRYEWNVDSRTLVLDWARDNRHKFLDTRRYSRPQIAEMMVREIQWDQHRVPEVPHVIRCLEYFSGKYAIFHNRKTKSTGDGLQDHERTENIKNLNDLIESKFPYYDDLHDLWGEKPNKSPPMFAQPGALRNKERRRTGRDTENQIEANEAQSQSQSSPTPTGQVNMPIGDSSQPSSQPLYPPDRHSTSQIVYDRAADSVIHLSPKSDSPELPELSEAIKMLSTPTGTDEAKAHAAFWQMMASRGIMRLGDGRGVSRPHHQDPSSQRLGEPQGLGSSHRHGELHQGPHSHRHGEPHQRPPPQDFGLFSQPRHQLAAHIREHSQGHPLSLPSHSQRRYTALQTPLSEVPYLSHSVSFPRPVPPQPQVLPQSTTEHRRSSSTAQSISTEHRRSNSTAQSTAQSNAQSTAQSILRDRSHMVSISVPQENLTASPAPSNQSSQPETPQGRDRSNHYQKVVGEHRNREAAELSQSEPNQGQDGNAPNAKAAKKRPQEAMEKIAKYADRLLDSQEQSAEKQDIRDAKRAKVALDMMEKKEESKKHLVQIVQDAKDKRQIEKAKERSKQVDRVLAVQEEESKRKMQTERDLLVLRQDFERREKEAQRAHELEMKRLELEILRTQSLSK